MLSKKYAPILLLSLILALAGCFSSFADEADEEYAAETGESSSLIVTDEIMKMWEQSEADQFSGPSILEALMGQAAADPDATGIASAVIGRKGNTEIDLPSDTDDTDALIQYYMALLAMLQNNETASDETGPGVTAVAAADTEAVDNTPITDAEGRELIPQGRFAVTKYCPCSICCGKSGGMTASGKKARSNHTIAADTRIYPFGTQLMINGIIYTVEDMGGSVRGNTVDIFVDNHSEAVSYGTQYADVYLVK